MLRLHGFQGSNLGLWRSAIDAAVSLGCRKFLVILVYTKGKLVFSIKSDETHDPKEAVSIAIQRVKLQDETLGGTYLGNLISATVTEDTEQYRESAGIRDVGYPAAESEFSWEWYNADNVTPLSKARGKPSLPVEDLLAQARLVEELGYNTAARKLGLSVDALKKRVSRLRKRAA